MNPSHHFTKVIKSSPNQNEKTIRRINKRGL
jgi:hypothetical protein